MTATSVLQGKLPEPERNGLATVAQSFVEDPLQTITVVCQLSAKAIESEVGGDGDHKVKFMIEHIEVVGGPDAQFCLSTMIAAHEKRTGIKQLDQFSEALANGIPVGNAQTEDGRDVDSATGEIDED